MAHNVMDLAFSLSRQVERGLSVLLAVEDLDIPEALARELLQLTRLHPDVAGLVGRGLIDRQVALRLAVLPHEVQLRHCDQATKLVLSDFEKYIASEDNERIEKQRQAARALKLAHKIFEQLGMGEPYKEICAQAGITMECLLNRLYLFDLVKEVHTAFVEGDLQLSNAITLAKLPRNLQTIYLERAMKLDCIAFQKLLAEDKVNIT